MLTVKLLHYSKISAISKYVMKNKYIFNTVCRTVIKRENYNNILLN